MSALQRTVLNNSDVGPWAMLDLTEEEGVCHSMPLFGPAHAPELGCWCHPEVIQGIVAHWAQQ